jgi:hypothetical protein
VARAGQVLENPRTGERLVFRRTAAETDGEALEYEIVFTPRGFGAQKHLHPRQQERHEVLEGELGIVVAGRERRLGPARPALRSAELAETLFGLGRDGKLNPKGNPNPVQLAVIGREFAEEGRATRPPAAVQRMVLAPLAALGRLLGYRGTYPQYSGGG